MRTAFTLRDIEPALKWTILLLVSLAFIVPLELTYFGIGGPLPAGLEARRRPAAGGLQLRKSGGSDQRKFCTYPDSAGTNTRCGSQFAQTLTVAEFASENLSSLVVTRALAAQEACATN
jgi:hypothetical protein